jgi:hypothetical protein
MTEVEFWARVVLGLDRLEFCAHVVAFGVCWIAGCQSLKYFLYVKNHRDLW